MTPWAAHRVERLPAWVTRRNESMAALPWAVWLGANTTRRLAEEWGVSRPTATKWLQEGRRAGVLRSRKVGHAVVYRVARTIGGPVA